MRRLLLPATIGFAVLCCCGGLAALWVMRAWEVPLAVPDEGVVLQVSPGDSLAAVATSLQAQGVLPNRWSLVSYGRVAGLDARIKTGEYRLSPGVSVRSLLGRLVAGDVIRHQVTLPEGVTLAEALRILWSAPTIERILEGPDDARLTELGAGRLSAEGLFLPETYVHERGTTDLAVLQQAHRALCALLEAAWAARAPDLPYETAYEALVMASIIERETGLAAERARIAGVFVRRLRRDMPLQTDPTVIYGLGEVFDGNLRRSHLRDADNRYNSYRHHGLPPTPIALPGAAAVQAALHPDEEDDSLYFVARGDGSHVFSATYEEHQRAVREFQLQRRDDYRSRPEGS